MHLTDNKHQPPIGRNILDWPEPATPAPYDDTVDTGAGWVYGTDEDDPTDFCYGAEPVSEPFLETDKNDREEIGGPWRRPPEELELE